MNGPLVIKIGGAVLETHASLPELWRAVVDAGRSQGVVLVHGGGSQVDALLNRLGLPIARKHGLRLTPEDQIDAVVGVLAGVVNTQLVGLINKAGGRAVGLTLGDGQMTACEKLVGVPEDAAFDPGRVGRLKGGDGRLVRDLLSHGYLPVVASIGLDAQGRALNVNADDAASGLCEAIKARALVLLTDVPGIRGGDGAILPETTPGQIEEMIRAGVIQGGMIPKARGASRVVEACGARVAILSGQTPGPLIDWLAGKPAGTTIVPGR